MKLFMITGLLFSLTAGAASYSPNDGARAPGTLTEKSNAVSDSAASTAQEAGSKTTKYYKKTTIKSTSEGTGSASGQTSDSGMINSSGVSTDKVNTSATPAPSSDSEAIDNTTLSGEKVEAQEVEE